ncbi:S8 family serine peptidase [Streptomyces sp. NPDC057689]|uniref:S8 family serine peptidase n=1 Tax=Streptomyces sp. NPDC057689 TaxID=3346213 RepID=UPI00367B6CF5
MTAMHGRNLSRPAAGALALLLTAALSGAGAVSAAAAGGNTVELPVLRTKLTGNAGCTEGSGRQATAVPWEQVSLQLGRAWQFASGSGVKVGVVDTGVSTSAPALKGRVTAVGGAGKDCVGHGTFVAGLIAAQSDKGVKFAGVARRSAIVAVRGTDERGVATPGRVASGIEAAVGAGAEVVTVSAAFPSDTAALSSAVRLAAKKDVLLVAAAVPDSPTGGVGQEVPARDYYPAASDGVLSVLDVDVKGERPTGAYTTGSAQLAAPGDGVVGIGPSKNGHYIGSGASLAAGYVAGAAALVRSAHPELTAAQTAELLRSSAYPDAVPRVDPYAAVTAVLASASTTAKAPAGPAADKESAAPVRMPEDRAAGPLRRAMWPTLAGVAVVVTVAWLAVIIPRGRRTGWRPSARRP